MFKRIPGLLLLLIALAGISLASSSLLYFEVLGVIGYDSLENKVIFFSMHQEEAMQKPSLGFDFIQRFSGERGDFAVLAVQARLAVNAEGGRRLEPQLYNAYLKYKARVADLWVGHNRPAFGLSSYFDSHSLLLQTLAMYGYGFDRDWGIGLTRDLSWGDVSASLTSGSGMPLALKGNYLVSARVSKGILSQENYNLGLSAAWGEVLDTMGYHRMSPGLQSFRMAGVDFTHLFNNWESRLEVMAGRKGEHDSFAVFWRTSISFFEEGRLKLEAQPVIWKDEGRTNYEFSVGISFLANAELILRGMGVYNHGLNDYRAVFQVYYYKKV